MNSETKNCQNCKQGFTIESEDFLFYEKIKVPPPTFCPECRMIRRMMWRNERSLYKRKCDMCEKNIISMYDKNAPFPVYCPTCFRDDKWDREKYQLEYDFSKPFFEQWHRLFSETPRYSIRHIGDCIDCEFTNYVDSSKNVYLSSSVIWSCENVFYGSIVQTSRDIVDSDLVNFSDLLYENIFADKNYNCKYVYYSSNCIDSNFLFNCRNCQNCFGCVNLHNKNYCILNEQYSKEEYEKKMKEFDLGSSVFIENFTKIFWDFSLKFPRRYIQGTGTVDSMGDNLKNCKNVKYGFNVSDSENIKYGYRIVKSKDSMDVCYMAAENVYEFALGGGFNSSNIKFIVDGGPMLNNVEYSDGCTNSSDLFGCINIQNKKYCILNKQYTKEEYFSILENIKNQMNEIPYVDKNGRIYKYGEFFPTELCPFGYNESVINDLFPLTKEETLNKGYKYKEKEENQYKITLSAKDIKDNIKDIDQSITEEVIECIISGKAFRITRFEFDFYKRMNIPIPRLHPDERYKKRLKLRNPAKLWRRQCMCNQESHNNHKGQCEVNFETTYAPDRPEIVYCEKCYQQEVY